MTPFATPSRSPSTNLRPNHPFHPVHDLTCLKGLLGSSYVCYMLTETVVLMVLAARDRSLLPIVEYLVLPFQTRPPMRGSARFPSGLHGFRHLLSLCFFDPKWVQVSHTPQPASRLVSTRPFRRSLVAWLPSHALRAPSPCCTGRTHSDPFPGCHPPPMVGHIFSTARGDPGSSS